MGAQNDCQHHKTSNCLDTCQEFYEFVNQPLNTGRELGHGDFVEAAKAAKAASVSMEEA
jgi:hypothetical protein